MDNKIYDIEKSRWLVHFAAITETDPVVSEGMHLFEDRKGNIMHRKNLFNVNHVLTRDQKYQGKIQYDEFSDTVLVYGQPVMDTMCTQIAIDLSHRYPGLDVPSSLVYEAVIRVAREHAIHPVRDYLDGLEWDGVERVSRLFLHYFSAVHQNQNEARLIEDIATCFLVSCVARVMKPGCKVDTTPIVYGGQGMGKSTAFRVLAGEKWFSDTPLPLGHKDSYQQLPGVWIYELAELDSFRNAESTQIKAMLSSQEDKYRPSYGRVRVNVPRQTVFVGTTNAEEFLSDETGSRRFWPIEAGKVQMEHLYRDRDQLWAEAVHLYQSGREWWLDYEQARDLAAMSDRFRQVDPWEDEILQWLQSYALVITTRAILTDALGVPKDRVRRSDEIRVAKIMRSIGYSKTRERANGTRMQAWTKA